MTRQGTTTGSRLVGLWMSAFLVAAAPGVAGEPPQPGATFVLVHGAWGGGWAWKGVAQRLRSRGYVVYRPTLTGLGEREHLASPDIGLETHIQDVVNVLLFEELRNVVLVGHSYGGMVISGVADRIPERIRQVVYVDAFVPEDGESLMTASDGGDWIQSMTKDGMVVPPWVAPDLAPPHDVPQSLKTFTDPISLKNPAARQIPTTYILTVDPGKQADPTFSPQAERARKRGWSVRRMEGDHNVQWSKPDELTELLDAVASEADARKLNMRSKTP